MEFGPNLFVFSKLFRNLKMKNLVYSFVYDDEPRVAVITSENIDHGTATGFQMNIEEFRTYKKDKMKDLVHITNTDQVFLLPLDEDVADKYRDRGATVFENLDTEIMYVVKLKKED